MTADGAGLRVEATVEERVDEELGRLVIPAGVNPSARNRCGRCAMPTSGRNPDLLVDTSIAVALSVADHEYHTTVVGALDARVSDCPATQRSKPSRADPPGATAVEHGLTLVTLDRRAMDTYRLLRVDAERVAAGGQTNRADQ